MTQKPQYTCNDYRLEMILLSLKQRLAGENLSEEERTEIQKEIRRLETEMGMARAYKNALFGLLTDNPQSFQCQSGFYRLNRFGDTPHNLCHSAGRNDFWGFRPHFFVNPPHHSVNQFGIAKKKPRFHTIYGIGSDNPRRRLKLNPWQLGSLIVERFSGDTDARGNSPPEIFALC